MIKPWKGVIQAPGESRTTKPRKTGITMVIDKGLGLHSLEDLIEEIVGEIEEDLPSTFKNSSTLQK